MNGKPRIKDIAEMVGVSPSTVSNVLNNRKGASIEIARRIRDLAAELNYETPSSANGNGKHIRLVVSRKHGLVVMDTQFFAELIAGIESECRANHVDLMITNLTVDDSAECKEQINQICSEVCGGIILLATELPPEDLKSFFNCRSRLLVLDNSSQHLPVSAVAINNYEAGYQAAHVLSDAGHKKIGYIGSKPDFNNMAERRGGFLRGLSDAGIPYDTAYELYLTPTLEGALSDMDGLLSEGKVPLADAYFAANDILAIGAIRAMQQHGIRLPEDVSIIGMDDLALCGVVTPNLSSLRVPRIQMGRTAVRQLLQDEFCGLKTFVDVEPVLRESTKVVSN